MKVLAIIPTSKIEKNNMIFAFRQVEGLIELGVQAEVFHFEKRALGLGFLQEVKNLSRHIRRFNPDILHAHYGTITSFLAILFFWKVPVVICFRGSDINLAITVSPLRRILNHLVSQFCTLFAKKTICVAPVLKDQIWVGQNEARVIPDGVDTQFFYPMDFNDCRAKLNLDLNNKILLFNAGRSPLVKRFDIAKKVAKFLEQRIENFQFIVFDGGTDADKVPLFLNAVDCVLLCSESEGSPLIIKEALACNLPIVANDVGDTRLMTKDVENCHIVERTIESMGNKIIEVFNSNKRSNGVNFLDRYSAKIKNKEVYELLKSQL